MKKLTIIQTLPELNAGGVERCTLEMAQALVADGHRSIVISNGGRLVAELEQQGSEHITLPVHRKSLSSLFQIRRFRKLLQEISPDIVHARSRMPAWIAWLALRKLPISTRPHFITTVHGLNSVSPYSAIMTKGEKVIVISQTVQDYILKHYPQCPTERLALIYEGIDPASFPYGYQPPTDWLTHWQAAFPQLQGKTVLALPGRLTRLKGHATFLRLITALRSSHPHVHGLIIGGADARKANYANEIRQQVEDAGLTGHVSFTGHRDDIKDVVSQCDLLFSLSTKPETFGRTVLEALMLGKPVLGWNEGGVSEILAQRYPTGAITPGNETELLAATKAWLHSPDAPANVSSFTLRAMYESTLSLYKDILAEQHKHRPPPV